jgi:hypothetical protein
VGFDSKTKSVYVVRYNRNVTAANVIVKTHKLLLCSSFNETHKNCENCISAHNIEYRIAQFYIL